MISSIFILSCIGFCVSAYLYLLEKKVKKQPSYKPFCDLSDSVSCTKPIKTGYSSLFSVSNALIAMIFYGVMAFFAVIDALVFIKILALMSCIASCYLAYLLIVKVKSLCLLCMTLYAINASMLFISFGM
jgi:vitamin-K-epoxide reductase (warfarin-sensitive)